MVSARGPCKMDSRRPVRQNGSSLTKASSLMLVRCSAALIGLMSARGQLPACQQALTDGNVIPFSDLVARRNSTDRGRDAGYPAPPAQIRTGPITHESVI